MDLGMTPFDLTAVETQVSEDSLEWRDAQMLRLIESVRFNPERLAQYVGNQPDRIEFLDFVLRRLGGRSQ